MAPRVVDSVNIETLWGLEEYLTELGVDPARILSECGVDPKLWGKSTAPQSVAHAIMEHCADRLGIPNFGLEWSKRQPIEVLGCVTALARAAPNLRASLQYIVRYVETEAPAILTNLIDCGNGVHELTWLTKLPFLSRKRQAVEQGVGMLIKLLRSMLSEEFAPLYVRATASRPAAGDSHLVNFTRCDIYYEQNVCAIALPSPLLDTPIASHNPVLLRLLLPTLERIRSGSTFSFEHLVDSFIQYNLPLKRCSAQSCADYIGSSKRAFQMRLDAQGLSFSSLLERRRKILAVEYLADTDTDLSDIAVYLGYSDQSAFSRAFKNWFNISPNNFRKRLTETAGNSIGLNVFEESVGNMGIEGVRVRNEVHF